MDFMGKGKQKFHQFPEPYDEIVFPDGASFPYMNGKRRTIDAILNAMGDDVDNREQLRKRIETYMSIYTDVHQGFVALGLSRITPSWLHFLFRPRLKRLMKYGALTVRDVQHAVLQLGCSKEDVLKSCLKAPTAHQPRLTAVLAHPIGDYGVQPRDASMAAHGVTAEHYIDGGSYTVGPTQHISINLLSVVRAYGGEALADATVRSIIMEKGRAVGVRVSKTSDLQSLGPDHAPVTEIRAHSVVCGTTVYNLYNRLLPLNPPVVQDFYDPTKRTIRQSNGHMFVFCKLKGDPDELKLPDHNLWYFNGDDLDEAFDEFYCRPDRVRPPVVYIGFPCTKDPTWKKRFPGVSNCIVISDG
jgi:all-trans-retinol 13,14-reductase